ncbi:MAG: DUF1549 domain-containing protein, partial [Verrucomicrobiae bacterium]|nr:DUF1549 domain-containing protein [Verrucomicrobiae bacterium]NNJ85691.1 DUF1549 domain-containing protein [Akkermansiaceae bacterium]
MNFPANISLRHVSLATSLVLAGSAVADEISFNQHIRPIFTAKCTKCHGGAKADGDLSLIYRSQVLGKGKSGKTIIVPGKPDASELFRRITTDDLDDKMPLQKGDHAEDPLTEDQIEVIRQWIEQGALWEELWAYIKPKKQSPPKLKHASWIKTPMDQFVLSRLEKEDLAPTSTADRAQWLRRASLDLIGLPPKQEELKAFLTDKAPDAYEKQVTRLLASPHFGERWAAVWMDLARYSDTKGYEKDPHRNIWPYRDYLIRSFNADKPYDQFLREQLAGDLFPDTTSDSLTATAFHRNTQTNTEGGTDDEEFRVAAIIDRVNTTWTATQGITFACVQCHAHPYEPIPHEDYFRFYDFFNSSEDADLDNDFPHFKVARDDSQRQRAADLHQQLPSLRRAINEPGRKLMLGTHTWEPLRYDTTLSTHGKLTFYPSGEIHASGTFPTNARYNLTAAASDFTAIRVNILPEAENPAELPERGSVLSTFSLHKVMPDGKKEKIELSYVIADHLAGPFDPLGSLTKGSEGFGGYPKLFGKRQAVFIPSAPVTFAKGEKLEVTIQHRASTTGNQACTLRRFMIDTCNNA